jgi:ABC-type sugar transport system ATPase subunit
MRRLTNAPAIRMVGISKSFPVVRALEDVSLEVGQGEVHAIVGENGAGKSTLMKILAGVYSPDSGSIETSGSVTTVSSPLDAQRLGIRMVYQELNLVPDLDVAENITLGQMTRKRGFYDRERSIAEASRVLAELDARIDPRELVGNLSISQQQLVEIAKAYFAEPRIVVLDEPTSSLSEHEAQVLFGVVRKMRAAGISVIYISHRLREVLDIADVVTVLRDGRRIDSRTVGGMTAAEMIRLMVGRDLTDVFPKRKVPIGDVVLSVRDLRRANVFEGIDIEVRKGEIVGLAGLVGAGRTEVARVIFGLDKTSGGSIRVNGEQVRIRGPRAARGHGIGYVPEDRKGDGIIPGMTVRANLTLPIIDRLTRMGIVRSRDERRTAESFIKRLGISPALPERRVETLSGGNQQKVVLGKWLAADPDVLILDEPTRGVDVGAKSDIHNIVGDLVERGIGILLISSELPEVLAVSDRIYVFHEGRISAEFSRDDATEQLVMAAATGEAL